MAMTELCVGHLMQDPTSTVKAQTIVGGTALCAECVVNPEIVGPGARIRPQRPGRGPRMMPPVRPPT